jgi:hypothetical protein
MSSLLGPVCGVAMVADFLDRNHYLGRARRGWAWSDEFGVLVLANPTSRHLPVDWLELTRWCLVGTKNGGSQQWSRVAKHLKRQTKVTTVISYSDPSAGHTGALYRACNWRWAPTWHRLVPPPSGNGSWDGENSEAVKDRWVYVLRPDDRRVSVLAFKDESMRRRFPEAEYREAVA